MVNPELIEEYCCICERVTTHRPIDDDIFFERGLECLTCHTVWEAEIIENEDE
jgi:hypothetical protein